jgi:hypothetical protein
MTSRDWCYAPIFIRKTVFEWKKYFTEALYTLCNLGFAQLHLCFTGMEEVKRIEETLL